jgi:hypothetical protein
MLRRSHPFLATQISHPTEGSFVDFETTLALERALDPHGYGQQTGLFAPSLAEHYDLAISSFYGLEGSPITWEGIPVFPGIGGSSATRTSSSTRNGSSAVTPGAGSS